MCRFSTRSGDRGFSLIEMIFAVGLFAVMMILVFAFFDYGTRAFYTASVKQGVQADALRVMTGLNNDLRRTHRSGVTPRQRTASVSVNGVNPRRDAIAIAGLKRWAPPDSTNFDMATGLPLWNRYFVYYATTDEENGKLYRTVLDPNPPPGAPNDLDATVVDAASRDDPTANSFEGSTPGYVLLASNVLSFEIENPEPGRYEAKLKLRERKVARPGSHAGPREEIYELVSSIRAENSFPPEED